MAATQNTWDLNLALAEFSRLNAPGVLGFFTHYEVTEVFAIRDADKRVHNVFTIAVAVESSGDISREIGYLSNKPISLKSLEDWKFGAQQYIRTATELGAALQTLVNGEWKLSGNAMRVGSMTPLPPVFVPPDSSEIIPLNRVLKNNFWNGSHVLEWADNGKESLKVFFANPKLLQKLSKAVKCWVPLGLASLSDRLGNLIVQLPITVVMTRFTKSHSGNGFIAELAWHPKATPRPLRGNCRREFDKALSGYASTLVNAPQTLLPMPEGEGAPICVIWDDAHNIVLSATGALHFIKTVRLSINVADPEPREFAIPQKEGPPKPVRIPLSSSGNTSQVGAPLNDPSTRWTRKRMYDEELERLRERRTFIQYLPNSGDQRTEHEEALKHIRDLISTYGQKGAWLWDPYLDAIDVLNTLAYCPYSNSDLRALTEAQYPAGVSAAAPPSSGSTTAAEDFINKQRKLLNGVASNWRGLKLEYRAKHGQAGWAFHDRFLIFPRVEDTALAWSLGTSVNSVGKAHHILQQVDNGQLILEAFEELWNELDKPEHLVWKKP